jgi:hypothetical protein
VTVYSTIITVLLIHIEKETMYLKKKEACICLLGTETTSWYTNAGIKWSPGKILDISMLQYDNQPCLIDLKANIYFAHVS